jgi:plastocyanin
MGSSGTVDRSGACRSEPGPARKVLDMKRILLSTSLAILLALALVACAAPLATATPTTAPNASPTAGTSPTAAASGDKVSISGFAFDPGTLNVAVGTTVTWTNADSAAHTIVFADFQSGSLAKGDTYQHKFDTAGTYAYVCGVHASMKGTVIVK